MPSCLHPNSPNWFFYSRNTRCKFSLHGFKGCSLFLGGNFWDKEYMTKGAIYYYVAGYIIVPELAIWGIGFEL